MLSVTIVFTKRFKSLAIHFHSLAIRFMHFVCSQPCAMNSGITKRMVPVDSFAKDFWCWCFVHLFLRGDCAERDCRRTPGSLGTRDRLRGKSWGRVLLDRVDFRGWATSKVFMACMYKIFLRREQYGAIKATILYNPLFKKHTRVLAELQAKHVLQAAVAAGEAASIRDLLRNAGVEDDLKTILRMLQVVLRRVPGTDSERSSLRFKFTALRLWSGLSFLFFTLNPNEWGSPLTLLFRTPYAEELQRFSLHLSDEEFEEIYGAVNACRRSGPRPTKKYLYRWALEDPVVCAKCSQG